LPAVQETADFVTAATHGAGVTQLIEEIIRDDLASRAPLVRQRHLQHQASVAATA
jgi:hypothetical protein